MTDIGSSMLSDLAVGIAIVLALELAFVGIIAALYRPGWPLQGAIGYPLAGLWMFAGLFIGSLPIAAQGLLTLGPLILCDFLKARRGTLFALSLLALALSFGPHLLAVHSSLERMTKLRTQFPLLSVADRLHYEPQHPPGEAAPSLAPAVERRLHAFDERRRDRHHQLARLHGEKLEEFIWAAGFGALRMGRLPRAEWLTLPQVAPIPVETASEDPYAHLDEDGTSISGDSGDADVSLLALHSAGVGDFVDAERTGYAVSRDRVAGFEPHQFSQMPAAESSSSAEWQIVRLELISLLKHETPVAYLSRNLPRMDELREAPTRPLEEFELGALERLRTDEDLVIHESSRRIRMVGAVRAGRDCLACHAVERGELLGAFSYELRAGAPPPPPDPPALEPQARAMRGRSAMARTSSRR